MFPDDYFADLYTESVRGRPTVPARMMATVMLLQSFEGLSDREAARRQPGCSASTPAARTSPRSSATPPTGTRAPAPAWKSKGSR
jgi:hypothetical protein